MAADRADEGAGDRREATPDDLRDGARALFGAQTDGRYAKLRSGQTVVAAIPIDPGTELAVIWSPASLASKSTVFLGVYQCGPDGERVSASSSIRVGARALPALAGALVEVMKVAAHQASADRPPRPEESRRG